MPASRDTHKVMAIFSNENKDNLAKQRKVSLARLKSAHVEMAEGDRQRPVGMRIKNRIDELKEKSDRTHSWLLVSGGVAGGAAVLGILGTLLVTWLLRGTA